MKFRIKYFLFSVFLTCSLGVTINAAAAFVDYKTENGATCQAYFGNEEGDIQKRNDGAMNVAAAHRWISCGVPRDNAENLTGTLRLLVYINQGAATTTRCFHRSADTDGASVQTINNSITGPGWLSLDSAVSSSFGTYMVYCYLPPQVRLSTILVGEYTPTD